MTLIIGCLTYYFIPNAYVYVTTLYLLQQQQQQQLQEQRPRASYNTVPSASRHLQMPQPAQADAPWRMPNRGTGDVYLELSTVTAFPAGTRLMVYLKYFKRKQHAAMYMQFVKPLLGMLLVTIGRLRTHREKRERERERGREGGREGGRGEVGER